MSNYIGNSTIKTGLIPGGAGGRGPQGPQGPTGNIGPIGPTGNTGPTGFDIRLLGKTGGNKVYVELIDDNNTQIVIEGLTGNLGVGPINYSNTPDVYYEFRATVPSSDSLQSLLIVESVAGVTTTFKVIEGNQGISFDYINDNLVVSGPSVSSVRNLQEGTLIGASGSAAISLSGFTYINGITYGILVSNDLKRNLKSLTNNINTSSSGITIQNTNIGINQLYYNSSNQKWYTKNKFKFNDGSTTKEVDDTDIIFDNNGALLYPYVIMGSCCFCSTDDKEINSTVCYNYMTPQQCAELGGSFSSTEDCANRKDDASCDNAVPENGVCCTCGTNNDTGLGNTTTCTQNLTKSQCLQLGFKYFKLPSGADCSSTLVLCDELDCSKAKKKNN